MACLPWADIDIQLSIKGTRQSIRGRILMNQGNSNRCMKRGRKKARFIMLEHPLFDSEAFNSLSGSAVRVLLSIMRCKNGRNSTHENPILCPYAAMNGNLGSATKARAIRELEEKGFIELTRRGGLMKQPNLYVLSGEWINWHEKQPSTSVMKQDRFHNES